jgi:hypothetical protein
MKAQPRYAAGTSVSAERSKAEIEKLLTRYGADQFVSGWNGTQAVVGFRMANRNVRILIPMPEKSRMTDKLYAQRVRERWRATVLVMKAKLEAVNSGISTFEQEFLANIYLPDGKTVGDHMVPQLEQAYRNGKMPPLLGFGGG